MIRDSGSSVQCTHIFSGTDFMEDSEYTNNITQNCDYIISNPPYSIKG